MELRHILIINNVQNVIKKNKKMETNFKVEEIIDGNIVRVNPHWTVGEKSGDTVFIRGYDLKKNKSENDETFLLANEIAKMRLSCLILDKNVELKNLPYHTPESIDKEGRLKCNMYVNNKNISTFFSEFQ